MMIATPSGTLIRKTQRQDASVVSRPPRNGPIAAIPPIVEPQIAKAIARSLPRNIALTVDSVAGRIIAPPMPCRKRPKVSIEALPAVAATRLAAMNQTVPIANSLRRPTMSPTRPSVISNEAKTSE